MDTKSYFQLLSKGHFQEVARALLKTIYETDNGADNTEERLCDEYASLVLIADSSVFESNVKR